jgi:predicted AAA+ superfamily ATPase
LVKFQRTRGVLRLMASVIHTLWERDDKSVLILPASLPVDDLHVQSELTRYLPDGWDTVIEKDVDGDSSLPMKLDREKSGTLGRFAAARRVARSVFLGSAPTPDAANKGIEDRRLKLGCVQPGESPNVFGDALRYLAHSATFTRTATDIGIPRSPPSPN